MDDSGYTTQGKATKLFGITFRSQLEAKWAYALNNLENVQWDYVDSPWHDFVIHAPWGDAPIEVKPQGTCFAVSAMRRLPEKQKVFIVQGEPVYNSGWRIYSGSACIAVLRQSMSALLCEWETFEIQYLESMWKVLDLHPVSRLAEVWLRNPDCHTAKDSNTTSLVALQKMLDVEREKQGIKP